MTPQQRFDYAMELYNEEDYEEAVNEFQALLLQYPGDVISDDAQFYLAMTRFKRGEYILAAYEFSKLIKNIPASEYVTDSQYFLAESYYELSPDYNLDQRYTRKAIEEYQAFIDFFPLDDRVKDAEAKINELNNKLARKEFQTAVIYEKMGYYTAALIYYESVLETYHDTPFAADALYSKIKLLIEREREQEAIAEINKFLKRYPEDSRYNEVEKLKDQIESQLSAVR